MELLKVFGGWALIILMTAAPVIVPLLIIQIFFGGVLSTIRSAASGNVAGSVLGFLLIITASAAGIFVYRLATAGSVSSGKIDFSGALTDEMREKPVTFHPNWMVVSSHKIINELMFSGAIDAIVGDLRDLPLDRTNAKDDSSLWDQNYRLSDVNAECAKSRLTSSKPLDDCFKVEKLSSRLYAPFFAMSNISSTDRYNVKLYFQSKSGSINLGSCRVEVKLPMISPEMLWRKSAESKFKKEADDELDRCKIALLRELSSRLLKE